MEYRQAQKFSKELKRFAKKYPSLSTDLKKFESVLAVFPRGNGSQHWNRLHGSSDGSVTIFKVRLACKSLRGKTSFRVIYACRLDGENVVYIDLIELYYKGEKVSEDQSRIDEYLGSDLF
jgi:hypothetical protein